MGKSPAGTRRIRDALRLTWWQGCAKTDLVIEMTTANKVTVFRILLVPAFVVQLLYYYESGVDRDRTFALVIFMVAAVLDGVDGYIARRYHQRSDFSGWK